MRTAGIDIGSRTVKLAIVEDRKLVTTRSKENSFNPLEVCRDLLTGEHYDRIMATGYGRHLFAERMGANVITEIKAAALGARFLHPGCRTIIDIGGQDTKAISLDESGKLQRFEMNDKCAAGTGRFLEVMAMALGCSVGEFGQLAVTASEKSTISSTCTVFAESEVISLIGSGAKREDIASGVISSISGRVKSLFQKHGDASKYFLTGGLCSNQYIIDKMPETENIPIGIRFNPLDYIRGNHPQCKKHNYKSNPKPYP
jgi:predicted CoA-substrate-specific enzyme activase